ncbi:hypothetical protein QJS66_07755 [Kocuria rhizophila]|nr:hypothetical protein QJS66_07755 [Kocuria rhizophila]
MTLMGLTFGSTFRDPAPAVPHERALHRLRGSRTTWPRSWARPSRRTLP